MSRLSYTAEGFRAAWRRPALTLAEITWRWAVGATSALLALFALFQYLSTLPVTNGELLFLKTRQPILVGQVLEHILRGNLNRVVVAGIVGVLALCSLWIFAASVGRLASVRELLEYFEERTKHLAVADSTPLSNTSREPTADPSAAVSRHSSHAFATLFRLNFLRAAATLAAILSLVGAGILAGFASPVADPQPALAFFLFLPLAALIGCVWSSLNWLLSLAAIFAVRDQEDASGAVSAAVTFFRQHPGPVFAVGTWSGLAHLVAWVGASSVISAPLGFAPILPWRVVVAAMIALSLAYFAVADWLYVARLAGYICIAHMPQSLFARIAPVLSIPALPQTTIDRDEPILSDLPNLAPEM
jgi:class 3 adenylate cyclase